MKLMRRWLLPALTFLIVVGAAVLPARVSQMWDARQFGQVHTEALEVGSLPVHEAPTLLDRMELFANQYSSARPILSSSTGGYADSLTIREQALALRELLAAWNIVPNFFFDEYTGASDEAFEYCSVQRLLLWDPAEERDIREPSCYYQFAWTDYETYHNKSLSVDVDAETGLPIQVIIWDTNIAQWFPYTREALADKAEYYFQMMGWTVGVDVIPMEPLELENKFLQLCFAIPDTDLYYWITHGPTTLHISLETMGGGDTDSDSFTFDG